MAIQELTPDDIDQIILFQDKEKIGNFIFLLKF
jgi:hypothetical protein